MSDYILVVDFGSTFSKFTLINKTQAKLSAVYSYPTTQSSTIMDGYQIGRDHILAQVGFDEQRDHLENYFCSSAWGGFKMVIIGFTSDLTQKAAQAAALGSGTRIVGSYFYQLTVDDMADIQALAPDAVLLTGGTDGGNQQFVLEVGQLMADQLDTIDVIYAGNKNAQSAIQDIFTSSSCHLYLADNVMPAVNEIAVDSVRQLARAIFMEKILKSNGLDQVAQLSKRPIIPTPTAVLQATELWGKNHQKHADDGTLVIDIGGATTDVHSFGKGTPSQLEVFYEGMLEPELKRTVEGDIGMRESAGSLVDQLGWDKLLLDSPEFRDMPALERAIKDRLEDSTYIPQDSRQEKLDRNLAAFAMDTAVKRHVGRIRKLASHTYHQTGKDMRVFESVIATGGILVHSPYRDQLLAHCFNQEECQDLRPYGPNIWIDNDYILSALGVIAPIYPELAQKLMNQHLVMSKA